MAERLMQPIASEITLVSMLEMSKLIFFGLTF